MRGKHLGNRPAIDMCCGIIQSAQKTLSVKVKGLHGGMSYHSGGKGHPEASQIVVRFVPPREFLGFEVRIRKNEWGGQVVLQQTATIVCEL